MIGIAYRNVEASCLDSQLASTREYWREKLGFKEWVVKDPRPLQEIYAEVKKKGEL